MSRNGLEDFSVDESLRLISITINNDWVFKRWNFFFALFLILSRSVDMFF